MTFSEHIFKSEKNWIKVDEIGIFLEEKMNKIVKWDRNVEEF